MLAIVVPLLSAMRPCYIKLGKRTYGGCTTPVVPCLTNASLARWGTRPIALGGSLDFGERESWEGLRSLWLRHCTLVNNIIFGDIEGFSPLVDVDILGCRDQSMVSPRPITNLVVVPCLGKMSTRSDEYKPKL